MKPPLNRVLYGFAILLAASYAVYALAGPKGVHAWRDKEREIQYLEKRNAELARQNAETQDRIQRLDSDPVEQERVIQERLKLVRPGDKVYVLPSDGKKK